MLNVVQDPAYRDRGRYALALYRRIHRDAHLQRFRTHHALRQLVGPSGVSPRYVRSHRTLGGAPAVVALDVIAYYFLSAELPKNKGGSTVFQALSRNEMAALEQPGVQLLLLGHEVFFPRRDDVKALHDELGRWPLDLAKVHLVNCNLRSTQVAPSTAALDVTRRRSHKVLSFNGQIRPHRIALTLPLLSEGLQSNGGIVSFLNYGTSGPVTIESIERALAQFPSAAPLAALAPKLVELAPLTLDVAANHVGDYFRSQGSWLYDDSYFSLVTDTSFADDDVLFITEKVYKPIANGHPFVCAGNAGALVELRRQGFETFAPYIDEGYDAEPDHDRRLSMIMAETRRLCRLDLDELHDLFVALAPRMAANRARLATLGDSYSTAAQRLVWDQVGIGP